MIIGFDASRAFTRNRTGTENYSYQILLNLSKIDHTNNYHVYLRPPIDLDKIKSSYPWPGNFKFLILNFKFLWTQMGLAKQTFTDPLDVLFIPAHTLPLIRKPGLKTVVTVHDLGAEYLPQTHQLKQKLYLKFMTHWQLKSATHLIAVSKATKSDLVKKTGLPSERVSVVYEGYNKKLFKPLSYDQVVDVLNQFDLVPQNYFLFVGTIQPRKNLARLISAYAKSLAGGGKRGKMTKLVLAGSKGWLSDEIYALPKKLGIEDQVCFLGYVPDEKLPALYSGARALFYPSLFEGFGLPILEAMATGCPVLTSQATSCSEAAGKAAILVNPYSEREISRGINLLLDDEKLKKELINKGFKQCQKFSWEKAARETLSILKVTQVT